MTLPQPHASFDRAGAANPALQLPPAFSPVPLPASADVFAWACRAAEEGEAGTLTFGEAPDVFAFAVVLAPEEPLRSARRAFFAGMNALAAAVGACAPPEKPIRFDWPDVLRFNGARIGAGRMVWPEGCREGAVPAWLVFGASLIVSKAGAGDPGFTPESTALEEEGFPQNCRAAILESFARYLLEEFDLWSERGFAAVAARYLCLLEEGQSGPCSIDENGDFVRGGGRDTGRLPLVPALQALLWRDPRTGGPRL